MPAFAIAPTFLSDFTRLTPDVQLDTLAVMRAHQAGENIDLETVADAADPRVRVLAISPDWSGVVVPEQDDRYRLLTVRPRDEALSFARELHPDVPVGPEPVDPRPIGPPELAEALTAPFDEWRLTLHPDHLRFAEGHFHGSAQFTGGPGTGKTVLALRRAAHLAERNAAARPEQSHESILLTTHNRTLAQTLADRLDQLLPDPRVRSRVRVATIDGLAHSVVQSHTSTSPRLIGRDELAQRWRAIALADGIPFSGRFLVDEWEQVLLAQNLALLPEYIRSERSGRVQHLAPEHRRQVWETLRRYVGAMRIEGLWACPQLAAEAARVLDLHGPLFQHVVVVESQDLHPTQWRMLRAAVPEGTDDLFLVGDPRQRITEHRVSLASLGIHVRGRSHRLRVAYRITQEILDRSAPILGPRADRGASDEDGTFFGDRSLLRGPAPVIRGCGSRTEEYTAMGDQVRAWLEAGVAPAEIAVAGRNQWVVRNAAKELEARDVRTTTLENTSDHPAVRLGTMHRLQGQEFRCVIMVGVSDHLLPPKAAIEAAEGDQVALEHTVQQERTLLFAACTRARDSLYVSYVGSPSRLIAGHH